MESLNFHFEVVNNLELKNLVSTDKMEIYS